MKLVLSSQNSDGTATLHVFTYPNEIFDVRFQQDFTSASISKLHHKGIGRVQPIGIYKEVVNEDGI